MALIKSCLKEAAPQSISTVDFLQSITLNQSTTLSGISEGDLFMLIGDSSASHSTGLSSELTGATKLSYDEGIAYSSTYICCELLVATQNSPVVKTVGTCAAFKLS